MVNGRFTAPWETRFLALSTEKFRTFRYSHNPCMIAGRYSDHHHVEYQCFDYGFFIEGETYNVGIDGKLNPSGKGPAPPDVRHFK